MATPARAAEVKLEHPITVDISGPPARSVARPAATAQIVTARIDHYNICSANRDACSVTEASNAVLVLVDQHRRFGSWFISANEICRAYFEAIVGAIGGSATMVYTKLHADGCPEARDGGKQFGNALFYPGGVRQSGQAWFLSNPGRNCAVDECRAMLCVKLGTFAGAMNVCTAHIVRQGETDENGNDLRPVQAAEYIFIARANNDLGRRLVMAGDFNLSQNELPDAYDDDANLVNGPTINAHTGLTKQIDHIFVQRLGIPRAFQPYCPTTASDHCWTTGTWGIPIP
jgi:endonuclease/exonuclease/phosphatase family metal-dependent hydrolase